MWTVAVLVGSTGAAVAQDDTTDERAAEDPTGEVIELSGEAPEDAEAPTYEVAVEDIRALPGSGNDTLRALQSMPGVARVPFGVGGLILRGASPRDTKVYLDEIEVPVLYHFGGVASFYPSAMLHSVEMQGGGFGAEYGRGHGGVVTLASRPGRGDQWRVGSEISLLDASARADGPALGGTLSFGLRRSYVDAILAVAIPDDSDFAFTLAPRYYDGQLRYDARLSNGDRVTAIAFASDDRLQAASNSGSSLDTFSYESGFVRVSTQWRRRRGPVTARVTPWAGYDRALFRFEEEGMIRRATPLGVRADLASEVPGGRLAGGIEARYVSYTLDLDNTPPPQPGMNPPNRPMQRVRADSYGDLGAWFETMRTYGELTLKSGLRLERYGLTGETVLDPRITASERVSSRITLRQSMGIYHQPPIDADVDPDEETHLRASRAVQTSAAVEVEAGPDTNVSVTTFYHDLRDLPVDVVSAASQVIEGFEPTTGGVASISREFLDAQFGSYTYRENRGRGRSFGAELLVSHRRGPLTSWLAYTVAKAQRSEHLTGDGELLPYVVDQRHVATAVGTLPMGRRWRFGTRLRLASGSPYTPVAGTYFHNEKAKFIAEPGPTFSERLPWFAQLDVRIDRVWKRPWGTLALFLDVQNVTNRANAEGVAYNHDFTERSYTLGLPILPSIGLEYRE